MHAQHSPPKSSFGDDGLKSQDRTMLACTDVDRVDLVSFLQVCWLNEAAHPRTLGHKELIRVLSPGNVVSRWHHPRFGPGFQLTI